MSLVKYEILNKVAEVHSFTKAASVLGLTQSAVSHAVSSLEKEFGFNLIHRNRTGVTLTEDGMKMLYEMRKVLVAEEHLQQTASNILGVSQGTVRIGLISTISTHWMPNIIHIMDSEFPGIRIELREGDYYEIEQWLLQGEVDCGFLNRTSSKQFEFMPLKRDPLLCIVSSHSPLYDRTEIDLFEIEDTPIIMPSYKGTNDVMTTFEKYGVFPNIRFELYDEKAIVSMVEHNLGISILPEMAISMLPDTVKALPLVQESYRILGLSTKQKLSPASQKFVEILKQWLENEEQ